MNKTHCLAAYSASLLLVLLSHVTRGDIIMQKRWAYLNISVMANGSTQYKNVLLTDSALYGLNSPTNQVMGPLVVVKSIADSASSLTTESLITDSTDAAAAATTTTQAAQPVLNSNGCTRYINQNLPENYIALVSRGECPFETKIQVATESKAAGVIIYNTEEDTFTMLTRGKKK
jgi:hypothetical protein